MATERVISEFIDFSKHSFDEKIVILRYLIHEEFAS